ncbi:hypothetical protein BIV57_13125 [Mangrovactinospora gilvigrisea]|uniref:Uncharacterized protein n=1 Tax=Mangrovactinospora gilvigrisea TaxID=1428644 RepID=A0A1J7C666_9ACTN|nr:hypothetical protein [Mangrovactinospora gilvigrisea]OIV37028.1 hypothetical protein BIV57_13125 [Mangrovactinospora gilvigrisea]
MLTTLLLAFAAGFCAGNGLPYYTAGSTGEKSSPSPWRESAAGNVLTGSFLLAAAAVCWHYAHVSDHPAAGWPATAVGVVLVGLIHARLWRRDPWHRNTPPDAQN